MRSFIHFFHCCSFSNADRASPYESIHKYLFLDAGNEANVPKPHEVETMKPGPSRRGNKARKNNLGLLGIAKIMSGESWLKEENKKPGAGQPFFRKTCNAQS